MAGSITVSSITLDSDNNFSIKSNTGATLFFANTSGVDIANSIGATAITSDKILSIANTKISGNIISSQITSVANTQISGNIISSQITSVANTQITGNITAAQITSVANTQLTGLIQAAQIGSANATLITSGTLPGARLPVGSVLQVVQSVYTTRYTTSSTGSWITPGMTGSITPSSTSSKILVSVNVVIGNSGGGSTNGATIRLTRNSSAISYLNRTSAGNPAGTYQSYNGFNSGTMHLEYLDSPSSVSSVTYGVDVWWEGGTNYGTFNTDRDNNSGSQGNATVTMMEIAA